MVVVGVDEFPSKEDDFANQAAQIALRRLQHEGDEVTPELDCDVSEALKGDGPLLFLVELLDGNAQDRLRRQVGSEGGQEQTLNDGGLGGGDLIGVERALTGFENEFDVAVATHKTIDLVFQRRYSDLENHQLLAMIAPRAFLLVGGRDDNVRAWPFIEASIPLWESHRPQLDIGEIGWFQHEKGHCWPPEAQEVGFAFLSKYLREGQKK